MESNEIYKYRIAVNGYVPCVIRIKQLDAITHMCVIENILGMPEFAFPVFIVVTSKYGDPAFKQYGKIPEDFMKKAWDQISERLDTPDWSEKLSE